MAAYATGPARYEISGGELLKITPMYDQATGRAFEQREDPDGNVVRDDDAEAQPGMGTDAPFIGEGGVPVGDAMLGPRSTQSPAETYGGGMNAPAPTQSTPGFRGYGDLTGGADVPQAPNWGMQPGGNYGGGDMGRGVFDPNSAANLGAGVGAGAPGSMADMAAQMSAGAGGNQFTQEDAERFRGMTGYGVDNPGTAMENIFLDMGKGLGIGNPFMDFMKNLAEPLAAAYRINRAQSGNADMATDPYDFRNFMRSALTGGMPGGAGGVAASAATQLPAIVNMIRTLNRGEDGNLMSENPFLSAIAAMMRSEGGAGTAALLNTLRSPFMARSIGEGYRAGLNRRTGLAQRAFAGREGAPPPEGDIWQQLLGMR